MRRTHMKAWTTIVVVLTATVLCIGCSKEKKGEAGDRPGAASAGMGKGPRRPPPDFSKLDVNGDGKVSADEAGDRWADRWAKIDVDGDGSLSEAELKAAPPPPPQPGSGRPAASQ
jgi:EF hand